MLDYVVTVGMFLIKICARLLVWSTGGMKKKLHVSPE